jgi:hypothetical protein
MLFRPAYWTGAETRQANNTANIEDPKTAPNILNHPKRLRHKPCTLSEIH